MKNNTKKSIQELDPAIDKAIKSVQTACPIHKVDFTVNTPNAIVGMYLLLDESEPFHKLEERFKEFDNDISSDMYIVFEPRHVMEACQIVNGSLLLLRDQSYIPRSAVDDAIGKIIAITNGPILYTKFKKEIAHIAAEVSNSLTIDGDIAAINRVKCVLAVIITAVWYLSYKDIDDLAMDAANQYKDSENK